MKKETSTNVHFGHIPVLTEVVDGPPLNIPVLTEPIDYIEISQKPFAARELNVALVLSKEEISPDATANEPAPAITLNSLQCEHFSATLISRIEASLFSQSENKTEADWSDLEKALPELIRSQLIASAGFGIIPPLSDAPQPDNTSMNTNELAKSFEPKTTEAYWYDQWESAGYFKAGLDENKARFTWVTALTKR